MRIGILSDSHGRVGATRVAVGQLLRRDAEMLIHLGDIETEEVLDELVGHNARIVFGNCDLNMRELSHYAQVVGIAVDHPRGRIETDGKTVTYTHGHLEGEIDRAMAEQPDYLLHGHTHEIRDEVVGRTRIINPGALFRAVRYTAAVLDVRTGELDLVAIPRHG